MWALFEEPVGRKLLSLLTADHGLPGDPRREALFHALQELRTEAEALDVPAQVKRAIRSALRALYAEFPASLTP